MSIRDGIEHYYPLGGMRAMAALVEARLLRNTPDFPARAQGIKHPLHMRVHTSDGFMFQQVLVDREYELPFVAAPRVIVDAGANVGFTSVFYANQYPRARVFAIEPAASNFRLLVKNTRRYEGIVSIHAALWHTAGKVSMSGLEFMHSGIRITENAGSLGEIAPAVTMETILRQYGIEYIDILKLDIEGAEKEVLENSQAWIDRVGLIAIETHDRFKEGCTQALERVVDSFTVRYRRGETLIFARQLPT